ncbi:uncharacterized protein BCR38DRAFT_432944 [Pseudomassariella vexata]|uniref:Uncharacterized protein n=1 Tax=Pseudomassariella vexata TaxID=1141098 RepID=A0A1Y2E1R3_9PEZI|nr:uncharacterized protein BCR38DRAFT_432944 [Pseudomassariella vexata]ORY65493.1 hypothetical protein BCR38DRAFT_432944 [Pseudomassariella vexata]
MSPPLPVPSKAAIHALRGIALGTSCAIGLIVEDRRRRMSTLRTAIHNKRRLKSSRAYHGAAEAVAIRTDDAGILSGDELQWHCQPPVETPRNSRSRTCEESQCQVLQSFQPAQEPTAADAIPVSMAGQRADLPPSIPGGHTPPPDPRIASKLAIRAAPAPHIPRDSRGWAHSFGIDDQSPGKDRAPQRLSNLQVGIAKFLDKDDASLDIAVTAFLREVQMETVFADLGRGWLELSTALCKKCQATGRWREAHKILVAVVRSRTLSESQFYAHDPIPIMDWALSEVDIKDKMSSLERLRWVLPLFTATFKEKPQAHAEEVERLGRTIIPLLFAFNQPKQTHSVFWRAFSQIKDPTAFTAWFINALFEYKDHKSVVKYFRLNFSKMAPDDQCFERIAEMVVQSVEELRGGQVNNVVRALAAMSDPPNPRPLKAGWLMRMSQAHWSRYKDPLQSMDLFHQYKCLGLLDRIDNPEYVYKVIVQLAVLAGHNSMAQDVQEEILKKFPHMAKDVGLNGYLALLKAKLGDWDGVRADFANMEHKTEGQQETYDHTFVTVLKVFSEDHPLAEVEQFIHYYTNVMGVQLNRYMVTLVANKYGECHDTDGFIEWLQNCSSKGFALDSSFCNAVLNNCRKRWKFSFRKLRQLFFEMRTLEPACVDGVTRNIMRSAALEDRNYANTTRRRLSTLKIPSNKLPYAFRSARERDVFNAMNEELICGHPDRAMLIYRRALRYGMPWCPRCFRVAIASVLKQRGDNLGVAMKLIHNTHQKGHDVSAAVAVFIKTQIDGFRGSFEEILLHLKTTITRFESVGVIIDSSVLTHAAIACVKFGHHAKAISLCKLAMERSGTTNPCFSRQSLRALIMAYAQNLDLEGMRWLIESLPSSPLAAERSTLRLLKGTKRQLKRWMLSPLVINITQLVQDGIDGTKHWRGIQVDEGCMIYEETLRIMGEAAACMERNGEELRQGDGPLPDENI